MATHRFTVSAEDAGLRLDQLLAARVDGLSRRKARVLLDLGGVFVDGARVKVASRVLRAGQQVEAHVGGALERASKQVGRSARSHDERALPAYDVIYDDEDVVVVDKPAGLLTAPTPESDRNNLAALLGARVVHRLDLQTSGLLVFARSDRANRDLSAAFREHDVRRQYLAVLTGSLAEPGARTVSLPVGGRHAVTHFTLEERLGPVATVVRCRLETGRTHQIRLHACHLGHPVLGDPRYGPRPAADRASAGLQPPRMALHATLLGFRHPRDGSELVFERPWPADLADWLTDLRARLHP